MKWAIHEQGEIIFRFRGNYPHPQDFQKGKQKIEKKGKQSNI